MGRTFIAPRDAIELRLSRLWGERRGLQRVDVRAPLADLGGGLEEASRLRAEVLAQFGVALSPPAELLGVSIEALGIAVRARSERPSWVPLVTFQPAGRRPPLFFVPGGDGNVFNFQALAHHLGPEQPFHGLQARGMYGELPPHESVEAMASDYLDEVLAARAEGPYLLAGHCFGAIVAFEMALELQRRGEQVALVAALDALAPAPFAQMDTAFLEDEVSFYEFIASGFRHWFDKGISVRAQDFAALPQERHLDHFMEQAKRFGAFPPDTGGVRMVEMLRLFRLCTGMRYEPKEMYRGTFAFFHAMESDFCSSPTGGWEQLVSGRFVARAVPGHHVSMVTEPHVEALAAQLGACIAEVTGSAALAGAQIEEVSSGV
ncbi:alpha/beta fold hydrolase [Chondromyces crocatus]|uniref:AMP-dependent ligase n=1 Tax=Chondromyces crocatus TaxID=52 RepID=A0A0K1E7S2_CHOCO|nr:alpha/beta fold hydrolase [Chondromyces crocatus]AKT36915.1 AMP-dependent ligase [Chondromyces crocatus]